MPRLIATLFALMAVASPAAAQLVTQGPWVGAVDAHSAIVVLYMNQNRLPTLEVSEDRSFSRPRNFPDATRLEGQPALLTRFRLTSLRPDTVHYYRLRAGNVRDYQHVGQFRTFPETGRPASFTFAVGSSAHTASESGVFLEIAYHQPLFFLLAGGLHDTSIPPDDIGAYRALYPRILQSANQSDLYAKVPIAYLWDADDSGSAAAHRAYRESVPHYPLVATASPPPAGPSRAPITQAFSVGRVRFILLDTRTARSPMDAPDGPDKTLLGAWQLDWLKQELVAAAATHPLIFVASSVSWNHAASPARDNWGAYAHERHVIADWIHQHNIRGVHLLTGNGNFLGFDAGENTDGDGFPEFQVSPLDHEAGNATEAWTSGPILPEPAEEFFGLVDVRDNVSAIELTFRGLNQHGQERLSQTITFATE